MLFLLISDYYLKKLSILNYHFYLAIFAIVFQHFYTFSFDFVIHLALLDDY